MVCGIPDNDPCFFSGQCEYQSSDGSLTSSSANLNGDNVCFDMHANYTPEQMKQGNVIPFTIKGTISPQSAIQGDTWPDTFPFSVSGTRKKGVKTFTASGTVGNPGFKVEDVQIDCNARLDDPDDIVDVRVWLPPQALRAQRIGR